MRRTAAYRAGIGRVNAYCEGTTGHLAALLCYLYPVRARMS
ncbi:hypothetical protein ASAP_1184 [Asaia bogorensis]|uniref:Uncharacterized protein n=1 Tax=Asaia bogorensis TaxID=91915 RepID=A0A060QDQ7_9PROT|nr:hypothetical protein ASAP_1184 [Asaia bogorensis]